MKAFGVVILLMLVSALAISQVRPEFEVASIKPSAEQLDGAGIGLHIDGSQVRIVALPLRDYISIAYRLKIYQITGPDWLPSVKFDVNAKLPDGGQQSQVPEMLQSLLESRFKLKAHHESKEFPVYAFVVTKGGLKLTPTPVDDSDAGTDPVNIAAGGNAQGVGINYGKGSVFTFADNKIEVKKLTMVRLADTLARFVDRPVVDMTDAKGAYDIVLDITPEDYRAMLIRSAVNAGVPLPPQALRLLDAPSGDSLASALEKVGLKLEARKAPLDTIVVDSMLKAPTDNVVVARHR